MMSLTITNNTAEVENIHNRSIGTTQAPRIAVLNAFEYDIPFYFHGGSGNDYQILVDGLNSSGYESKSSFASIVNSGL